MFKVLHTDCLCLNCGDPTSWGSDYYCSHCVHTIQAEIERGFEQLSLYLSRWAAYQDWLDSHGD